MSTFADLPDLLRYQSSYVSSLQLQKIAEHFGDSNTALNYGKSHWQSADLLNEQQLEKLFAEQTLAEVDAALEWAEQYSQGWLTLDDERYPASLKEIADPPFLLGYRGNVELLSDPQIAVVGSRHASKAGIEAAKDFAHYLSDQGITITSGLALGIDTAAHQGALLGMGKTVAVVATGLDRIYPASNRQLGTQIVDEGVMVSEFALGTKPLNYNFPRRNRIISGLSVGTLVVEAALKSGSLITARTALEQGREVFAVPGSIHNPLVKGCHQLIKQGAKLVESGQDILQELANLLAVEVDSAPKVKTSQSKQQNTNHELNFADSENAPIKTKNSAQAAKSDLLKHIEYDPISLDELVVLSKMPVSALQSELLMLELSGDIEALSAGRWRRLR